MHAIKGYCARLYYADRCVFGVLTNQEMQRWIRLSYDLVCQYLPNLLTCISGQRFPGLVEEVLAKFRELEGNISQVHILPHIGRCKALFSFNYTPGCGRSCGDNVESPWAKTKRAGGSLKQMNHGLRHDVLDFLLNDWNWSKVIGLGGLKFLTAITVD